LTVFALYARSEDDWLSVASLVRLMADLGLDGAAVRSAISRLKRRGVLRAQRHGSAAGYALEGSTLEVLAEGDRRIFEPTRAVPADGWILVAFSVPEAERDKRHELRTSLTRLGFGTASPGVWIAPGNLAAETRRTLERRGLTGYVDLFTAQHIGFGDLRAKIRTWWDLDELAALYDDFIHRHQPLLATASATATATAASSRADPAAAFRSYVQMLTEWRRLPYRDPGLPLQLLPPGWSGQSARVLFDELDSALSAPAREHARTVIHSAG
jgi:phenylacetic acid degradation operon negative regulatory protein